MICYVFYIFIFYKRTISIKFFPDKKRNYRTYAYRNKNRNTIFPPLPLCSSGQQKVYSSVNYKQQMSVFCNILCNFHSFFITSCKFIRFLYYVCFYVQILLPIAVFSTLQFFFFHVFFFFFANFFKISAAFQNG